MYRFRLKYSIIDNNGNTIPIGAVLSVIGEVMVDDGYTIKAADSDGNEVWLNYDKKSQFDHEILSPRSEGLEINMNNKAIAEKLIELAESILIEKNDQHGNPIPDDLVLLPTYDLVYAEYGTNPEAFDVIMKATWYEANGILMASYSEIGDMSEDDPIDAGVDLSAPDTEVLKVDDALKRYSQEDGFYHA